MSVVTADPNANEQWISLNFVMASTLRIGRISIDNHQLWLYEIDGVYVGERTPKQTCQKAMIDFFQSRFWLRCRPYTLDNVLQ
jgi:hypothetical protein